MKDRFILIKSIHRAIHWRQKSASVIYKLTNVNTGNISSVLGQEVTT